MVRIHVFSIHIFFFAYYTVSSLTADHNRKENGKEYHSDKDKTGQGLWELPGLDNDD